MADDPFLPPPVPLMSAVKARDLARECQGMANYLRERGEVSAAIVLERRSAWWMAYAVALSQIPPGKIDKEW